jgi:hypothetical protein
MAALGKRTLVISIGGTDYTADVSKVVVTSGAADSDFTSFADAAAGGAREYKLEFTARQDLVAGTLWDKVFTTPGTSAAVLIKPYGGAAATATNPHFTANATITEPDGDFIGGEADASTTARQTFECSWVLAAKPVRVVA